MNNSNIQNPSTEIHIQRPYAPFLLDALPDATRAYVQAAAAAIPCSPAYIALPVLATLSAAIGSKVRLVVKPGWLEPATIWTMILAPSGSAKSPAMQQALRPVYRMESEALERYEYAMQEYRASIEGGGGEDREPVRTRYRTGSATPEAVIKILRDNPQGVLLARDELAAWLGSFDRYAKGAADLQFWIEAHGGMQVSNDRVSSGNATIDRPAVAVTGTIQPGTLREKLGANHFDTGFAARLLLAMPPATPKTWSEDQVTQGIMRGYEQVLESLYEGPREDTGLTRGARALVKEFVRYNGRQVFPMPEGPERAVASKTEMHALRLALILHMTRYASGEVEERNVDADSVKQAIQLSRWMRDETLRVYEALDLVTEAVPPIQRFARLLPSCFTTPEAMEIAARDGIPESTVYKWLRKLLKEGTLEKPRRGFYRNKRREAVGSYESNAHISTIENGVAEGETAITAITTTGGISEGESDPAEDDPDDEPPNISELPLKI